MRQLATPILAMKTNCNFDNAAKLLLSIANNDLIGDLEAPFSAPKLSIAEQNAPDPIKFMETFAQALTAALKGMTVGDDQRSTFGEHEPVQQGKRAIRARRPARTSIRCTAAHPATAATNLGITSRTTPRRYGD